MNNCQILDVVCHVYIQPDDNEDGEQANALEESVEDQIESWLRKPAVKFTGPYSSLQYWKEHHNEHPLIAKMALKYLAVQAASAPSERVFSVMKNVCLKRKSNLDPAYLSSLLFLKWNSRHFPLMSVL